MEKLKCHKCGASNRTLRRVRDASGKKVVPALYECSPYCIHMPKPTILSKEELLAESARAKAARAKE
jgi:hypothetical protein